MSSQKVLTKDTTASIAEPYLRKLLEDEIANAKTCVGDLKRRKPYHLASAARYAHELGYSGKAKSLQAEATGLYREEIKKNLEEAKQSQSTSSISATFRYLDAAETYRKLSKLSRSLGNVKQALNYENKARQLDAISEKLEKRSIKLAIQSSAVEATTHEYGGIRTLQHERSLAEIQKDHETIKLLDRKIAEYRNAPKYKQGKQQKRDMRGFFASAIGAPEMPPERGYKTKSASEVKAAGDRHYVLPKKHGVVGIKEKRKK